MEFNYIKYRDNYLKQSAVTPDLLLSSIPFCCDEQGVLVPEEKIKDSYYNSKTFYQRNTDRLDPNEVLFVHYLNAVRLLFNDDALLKSKDPKQKIANQQKINDIIELLLIVTDKSLINYRKLVFNSEKFKNENRYLPTKLVKEMPYAIAYIALKRGYPLDNKYELYEKENRKNLDTFVSKDEYFKKIKDTDYILTVGEKLGIPYEKYLNKNGNSDKKEKE